MAYDCTVAYSSSFLWRLHKALQSCMGVDQCKRLVQESFGSLPNQRLPTDPFFPKHSEIPISPYYRHVYLTPPHHLLGCVTFSTSCLWLGCNLEGMMWWRKIKCDASCVDGSITISSVITYIKIKQKGIPQHQSMLFKKRRRKKKERKKKPESEI